VCGKAVKAAEKDQLVNNLHFLVQAALFRQITYALKAGSLERLVKEHDLAGVWNGDAHHHSDGAGLACTIGPQQAKHLARLDGQAKVVHRNLGVVSLGDTREFNNRHEISHGFRFLLVRLAWRRASTRLEHRGELYQYSRTSSIISSPTKIQYG